MLVPIKKTLHGHRGGYLFKIDRFRFSAALSCVATLSREPHITSARTRCGDHHQATVELAVVVSIDQPRGCVLNVSYRLERLPLEVAQMHTA